MALSKETARRIVDAVSKDTESKRRVNSWIRNGLAAKLGQGGALRNLAIASLPGIDPTDRDNVGYKWSCDGIAEATTKAINRAVRSKPGIPALENAGEQARIEGYSHTGTRVTMKDGTSYVFDWWKSLDVEDPRIFRFDDFMHDRGNSVSYTSFKGWS